MKLKIRHRAVILFFALFLLICTSIGIVSFAQSEGLVTEGESLDSINIGKSTMDDVVAFYGDDYKLINHKGYSYEMVYKNLGLSFYACQADPNKEIFVIEIESPANITTGKGIKLGESTFADISRIYDVPQIPGYVELEGIYFYADQDSREDDPEVDKTQRFVVNREIETPAATNKDTRIDQSNIVLDGIDISNDSESNSTDDNDLVQKNDDEEDGARNQTVQSNENQADDKKKEKSRIVKRIDLIEKSGLRQCDSKFPKSKNK